jgi:hypothetical protein
MASRGVLLKALFNQF